MIYIVLLNDRKMAVQVQYILTTHIFLVLLISGEGGKWVSNVHITKMGSVTDQKQ